MDWLDPEQVRKALSRPQDFKGCADPSHIDQDGTEYARPSWAMVQFVRALAKQTEEASDPYECWCITLEVARLIAEAMEGGDWRLLDAIEEAAADLRRILDGDMEYPDNALGILERALKGAKDENSTE